MFYEKVVAPLLFMMEAESAHNLALTILRWASVNDKILTLFSRRPDGTDSRLQQTVGGLRFPNPIGLAAGFDKNGVAAPAPPSSRTTHPLPPQSGQVSTGNSPADMEGS